jgi:hypothetical protein
MSLRVLQHTINGVDNQVLNGVQQLLEGDERKFALDVRVLGQVTTCARLLGTVGLGNAEHVAQGSARGLQVQLRRLGQIGLLAEVVQLEQGRAALDLSLHERWRKALVVATREVVIAEALRHDRSQSQNFRCLFVELVEIF